jgi:Ca2+-binding RTX toxin-like protein
MAHITAASSVYQASGNAFTGTGPDTLIVDANAFLISEVGGYAALLAGSWNVIVNGEVEALDGVGSGFRFNGSSLDVTKVTVGSAGDVFGGFVGLNLGSGFYTIVNKGTISGSSFSINSAFLMKVTNIGTLNGDVISTGVGDDIFTNFQKVGKVIKSGTVVGTIDLGAGVDHFNGGAHSETVRDGVGADTYNFGAGNDIYLAVRAAGGTDVDIDIVNGGSGVDTYDASDTASPVTILLGKFIDDPNAQGANVGFDAITGFENAIGGQTNDVLIGSNGANTLDGGFGFDLINGRGGRDVLTGGFNPDTFAFGALSDSGVTARTRDVITDFAVDDKIDLSFIDANSKTKTVDDVFHLTAHNGFDGFTHHAAELRFQFTSGGNTIVSGDANGDGKADFSILLQGHILLDDTNFTL